MAVTDHISEAEAPLLNDTVGDAVDFKCLPADRSKTGAWKSAAFIIGVEVAEKFTYFGLSSNLISYLTDSFGQSTATAAANVNVWTGTAELWPLFGAFLADSFLGQYRMIIAATVLYILGLGFLTLSAALHTLYSKCKNDPNNSICSEPQLGILIFFFFSLYLVAFAQGGHKPCVQAFGVDQFDEEDPRESIAKSSFFNWYSFSGSIGIFISFLTMGYIQENLSWELGIGLLCIIMCASLVIFLLGNMTYRFRVHTDKRNPFVRIGRVYVKAALNWKVSPTIEQIGEETGLLGAEKSDKFRFLDKALITSDGLEDENSICNQRDVDDARAILMLFPIWSACLVPAIVHCQQTTFYIKQGATMDRYIYSSIQIPVASLRCFVSLSLILFVPIYDRVLVPIIRSITKKPGGITVLQRIGIGILIACVSMVIAALVETKRLATASKYGLVDKPGVTLPMSVLWLVPQYVLDGIFIVLNMVGLQEFFYQQVPKELKSIGIALHLSVFGIGSFLSSFLISMIETATSSHGQESWFSSNLNRAHLDYFYWLLACACTLSLVVYGYFARAYAYQRK